MSGRLAGKVAFITGAARGIGAACMQVFAKHDYAAFGLDILSDGQAVAEEIRKEGGEALFLKCDVADEGQVAACVQQVGEKYNHIDVLVNNAGIVLVKPFDQIT